MIIDFQHHQAAHCENGVISNLLRHRGLELSEPMIFGIGSGLFFAYIPFIKLNYIPMTTYRIAPGSIFTRATKNLGIQMIKRKFSDPEHSMNELDKMLEQGIPVGLQVGAYHLTYFPRAYRFHFNMHNIVVFGYENGKYQISDPVMEATAELSREELQKVRFAKGPMQPNGKMYYPVNLPEKLDFKDAVIKGIRKTSKDMTTIPIPFFAIRGIRYLARQMRNWERKLGKKQADLYLGSVVRMQEEIGTGGAGFRFIFGAFLQEASKLLGNSKLFDISREVTAIGDKWRNFAVISGRIIKQRNSSGETYQAVSDLLVEIASDEERVFNTLRTIVK